MKKRCNDRLIRANCPKMASVWAFLQEMLIFLPLTADLYQFRPLAHPPNFAPCFAPTATGRKLREESKKRNFSTKNTPKDVCHQPNKAAKNHPIMVNQLDKIFKPQSIAVIGASTRENSVGHSLFKNLIDSGYAGHRPWHCHRRSPKRKQAGSRCGRSRRRGCRSHRPAATNRRSSRWPACAR